MITYLALGSNLGDKSENLLRGIGKIAERIGIFSAVSSVYETSPWGFCSDNSFLNQVVCVETFLSPEELLFRTQQIEKELGRKTKSDHAYHDRIIDIDIIMYDNLILELENLILPHPLFHQRRFVLEPLNEIAPDLIHPVICKSVSQLMQAIL